MSFIDLFKPRSSESNENKVSSTRNKVNDIVSSQPADLQLERAIFTSRRYLRRMRRAS
jgi:hypothetical protein